MIGKHILKKKYEEHRATVEQYDPDAWIQKIAEEHNTDPEVVAKILTNHDWFETE
jgi:hypothetical protein